MTTQNGLEDVSTMLTQSDRISAPAAKRASSRLDPDNMILNEETGPASPENGPVLQTDNEGLSFHLTLDGDSSAANYPKVVDCVTLGTCTSEMVWIPQYRNPAESENPAAGFENENALLTQ